MNTKKLAQAYLLQPTPKELLMSHLRHPASFTYKKHQTTNKEA